jgi:DNA-binding response OmpR family regulator
VAEIQKLLMVDDDRALVSMVCAALTEEGYSVSVAHDGRAGLERFLAEGCDLLLLDVLMPEMDGLELCRRIRQHAQTPIIFLTSRSEEVDRITGLESGADDYLVKPFSTRELIARIRAIGRRLARPADPSSERLTAGPLAIDIGRFEVRWNDALALLTRSEFQVLTALVRQQGFVLSRDRLIDLAKGNEVVITERTIDTFVKRIRQKLRALDETFDEIETVVGVGYRFRKAAR